MAGDPMLFWCAVCGANPGDPCVWWKPGSLARLVGKSHRQRFAGPRLARVAVDPYDQTCPTCGVEPGMDCTNRVGRVLAGTHKRRGVAKSSG